MTETRIYGPTCWHRVVLDEPLQEVLNDCYLNAMKHQKVGDEVISWAGAPGTGCIVYEITRMDETGVFGSIVYNNIRELEPWEVI